MDNGNNNNKEMWMLISSWSEDYGSAPGMNCSSSNIISVSFDKAKLQDYLNNVILPETKESLVDEINNYFDFEGLGAITMDSIHVNHYPYEGEIDVFYRGHDIEYIYKLTIEKVKVI